MMIVADQDRVEDGDRVIIFNGVTIQELRKFVSDIYCDFPCFGWNHLDIPKPLKIVAEEEYDGDCTVQWGVDLWAPAVTASSPTWLRVRQNISGTLSTPSLCLRLRPVLCRRGGLATRGQRDSTARAGGRPRPCPL